MVGRTPHDVVVVGAGPAGLYAAATLAGQGLDVVVLEEHVEIGTPAHCTGVVSAEAYDLYKIPEHVILHRPSVCLLVSPGGAVCELRSSIEKITVLDRAGLDLALAANAEEAGAAIVTQCPVENVRVGARGAEIGASQGRTFRARAVVLACGVTYRFNRQLGFGLPPNVLHTAQTEVAATPAQALEVHIGRDVAPEGFVWVVPVWRGSAARMKIGVLLRGDAGAYLRSFLARPEMTARVTDPGGEPIRRLLPLAPVSRSFGDRVLAVGDAAGLTKPVTGGGIFYSLLSAAYAAEELVEALHADDLSARRLARYERRWRQRLQPEIKTGCWFRRMLTRLSDAEFDTLVTALATGDVQSMIRQTARFNWHRSIILALLRQRGIKSILFRSFFR